MKPVIIIAIAFVLLIPISAHAQISIETDKPNYGVTDIIRITGHIENFETFVVNGSPSYKSSEPLTITLYQNGNDEIFSQTFTHREPFQDIQHLVDGYFAIVILPKFQLPINWSGEYKVVAEYQEQSTSTTFSLIGTDTFQGLTSFSRVGLLQIDSNEYEINDKSEFINVNGILSFYTDRSIVFELSDENSIIDSKEFDYESPVFEVPNEISDKLRLEWFGSVQYPISTQFELSTNLPSGTYFIEMYMPPIPYTAEEESRCKYLQICSGKNNYEHVPKIEFSVTNLSENQKLSNASTIEPEAVIEMEFYENEFYKFSFNIPVNWTIRENVDFPDGTKLETMMYPDEFPPPFSNNFSSIGVALVEVPVSVLPILNNVEIENFVVNLKQDPNLSIHNFDIESTSWGWIYTEEYSTVNDNVGGILAVEKGFIFKDRTWYAITYAASDKDFDEYYSVYDNVIDTLVINEVELNNTSAVGQTPVTNSTIPCATGTIENAFGQCVPDPNYKSTPQTSSKEEDENLDTKLYYDDKNSFSVEYPDGWEIFEEDGGDFTAGILFSDGYETNADGLEFWTASLGIWFYEDVRLKLSDVEEEKRVINNINDLCDSASFDVDDAICYDLKVIKQSSSISKDGYPIITTEYTTIHEFPGDPVAHPMVRSISLIYVGNDIWEISSESHEDVFDENEKYFVNAVNSFNFPASLPVLNNTGTIFSAITDEEQNWILILIAIVIVAVVGIAVVLSRKKKTATPAKGSKTKKFCRKCGSTINPKSRFCGKCGVSC